MSQKHKYFEPKLNGPFLARLNGVRKTRRTVLVLSRGDDGAAPTQMVTQLRRQRCITVAVDACDTALEMMEVVDFTAVVVVVGDRSDWRACTRIVARARSPVVVATPLLSRDRRYRRRAFDMGVAAYVCRPYTRRRLCEMLKQLRRGRRGIELIEPAVYRES